MKHNLSLLPNTINSIIIAGSFFSLFFYINDLHGDICTVSSFFTDKLDSRNREKGGKKGGIVTGIHRSGNRKHNL